MRIHLSSQPSLFPFPRLCLSPFPPFAFFYFRLQTLIVSHLPFLACREAKAVNAWFANKRSATKKKTRGAAHPYSSPASLPHFDNDDDDDENRSLDRSRLSTPLSSMDYQMFPSMDSDNRHVFDSEISMGIPRRMRIRPTPKQTEELRRLYNLNTHPTREEREALGDRIGMYVSCLSISILHFSRPYSIYVNSCIPSALWLVIVLICHFDPCHPDIYADSSVVVSAVLT